MLGGRRYRTLTCLLCAATALVVAVVASPSWVDGPVLDLVVALRAALGLTGPSGPSPIAVIALDARSLDSPELAPYPRALLGPVWARLLDGLAAAGTRVVGFDILFAHSANRVPELAPEFDRPFIAALVRHRERLVILRSGRTLPAPPFLAALEFDAATLGLAELPRDPDGRYRRVPAAYPTEESGAVPTLAGALVERAQGPPMPAEVILTPRHHLEALPTYALVDVLRCIPAAPEAVARAFGGKVVLIGTTLPEEDRRLSSGWLLPAPRADGAPLHPCGLRPLRASAPDEPDVPGVFLHAAAVETVLSGRVTALAPRPIVAALAGAAAATGAGLGLSLSPWLAAVAVLTGALLVLAGGTLLLAGDLWLPLAVPLGSLGAAAAVAYVARYLVEERTRRRIQHAFSHYLSPTLVARLAADPGALVLGGERREVTVMFADLSGFTALSSKVEPEVLTRLTNQYLGYIVEQVEATGGYVDKFIGDAAMAIWGAPAADPDHAANAVRAALGAVARIRQESAAATQRGEPTFSVKIGINSGPAVVGNVGTARRYNYTAVGETVNVASRLESVPGLYGCQIVLGTHTAELTREAFLLRELDTIQVKGRERPLTISEPVTERARASTEEVERATRYAAALAHYRARHFADAEAIWSVLAREEQALDGHREPAATPAGRMAARARAYADSPPPPDWDAVWVLTSK
jgi:adenylate cyclase